jgi:hypothetical protein
VLYTCRAIADAFIPSFIYLVFNCTEFWEEYANCADIAEGKYDQLMIDFAVQIMADRKPTSPPFYIRTLHEQVLLPTVICALMLSILTVSDVCFHALLFVWS